MTPEREAQMREMFSEYMRAENIHGGHVSKRDFDAGFLACARALEPKWQPIETAPKFGEPIDIWGRHGRITDCVWGKPTYADGLGWIHEAGYDSNGPVLEFVVDPTHWMPLSEQPNAAMSAATVALHVEGEHFVYGSPEATALAQAKFYKADAAAVAEPNDNGKLFCDLRTDEEKSNFFLSGRAYETGVIALSIQNDVAMAYHRCAEYAKAAQQQAEQHLATSDPEGHRQSIIDHEAEQQAEPNDLTKAVAAAQGKWTSESAVKAIARLGEIKVSQQRAEPVKVYPQGVMGIPPYDPRATGSHQATPGLTWNAQQAEPGADERATILALAEPRKYSHPPASNYYDFSESELLEFATKLRAAQSGQRAGVEEDLSADDLDSLRKAARQFEECGETEVSYDDCMRFARMGLLDVDAFILSPKGAKLLAAAAPTQQQEGGK